MAVCWLKDLGLYLSSVTNSLNPASLPASLFLSVKWVLVKSVGFHPATALKDETLNQKTLFLFQGHLF